MRKTAYFSLVLMLAAVVLGARFGARPEAQRLAGATIATIATTTTAPTSDVPVTAAPTLAPTAAFTPALSPWLNSIATESATRASAPDVLSRSGSDRPAETDARRSAGSRALTLPTSTVTVTPTDLPSTATSRPTGPPPTATTGPAGATHPQAGDGSSQTSGPPVPPEHIVAPTIGLDSKITPVGWHEVTNADGSKASEWDVASYTVSWHKTSARLGEAGNTVLTGHNNIEGEVFRHLEHFNVGDPITIYAGQRAFQYVVTDKFIVQETGVPYEQRLENAKWIGPFADERITLMSCWPYTGNTHRIFIIAKPTRKG